MGAGKFGSTKLPTATARKPTAASVVALYFTSDLDELVFGEEGTDLENAPRALLTEVAYVDLKATTATWMQHPPSRDT